MVGPLWSRRIDGMSGRDRQPPSRRTRTRPLTTNFPGPAGHSFSSTADAYPPRGGRSSEHTQCGAELGDLLRRQPQAIGDSANTSAGHSRFGDSFQALLQTAAQRPRIAIAKRLQVDAACSGTCPHDLPSTP
jgi:hypothetical protein